MKKIEVHFVPEFQFYNLPPTTHKGSYYDEYNSPTMFTFISIIFLLFFSFLLHAQGLKHMLKFGGVGGAGAALA